MGETAKGRGRAATQFPHQRNANQTGRSARQEKGLAHIMGQKIAIGKRRGKPISTTRQDMMFDQQIDAALNGVVRTIGWVLDRYHKELAEERQAARNPGRLRRQILAKDKAAAEAFCFASMLALTEELVARGIVEIRAGTRRVADGVPARLAV